MGQQCPFSVVVRNLLFTLWLSTLSRSHAKPKMQILSRLLKISSRNATTTTNFSSSATRPLRDSLGRGHDYLRVSLTERCNLRCKYCMPEEGITLTDASKTLSLSEIKYLTSLFVKSCGITKIRLTGGEPTIDRKLVPVLQHLSELRKFGLQTIAMTTNGSTLKARASMYKDLGLDAVNISLDTLKPEKFEEITRRKGWKLVFEGVKQAVDAGFKKVKLNCVVVRGFNDDELVDFARLTMELPIEVRFIEFMPFLGNKWAHNSLVPYKEMLQIIRNDFPGLIPMAEASCPNETSKSYRLSNNGMLGSIGFISSLTDNFCHGCNRLRLTTDGNLKVCLFDQRETSLRDLLRNGASDVEIVRAMETSLWGKKKQHAGMAVLQRDVSRPMIKIARRLFHGSLMRPQPASGDTLTASDKPASLASSSQPVERLANRFSHLDNKGQAKMVNVGAKARVKRIALARGEIAIGRDVLALVLSGSLGRKGDVLSVAKLAGIMGAKATSNLIPMCHQIPLDHVQVDIEPRQADGTLVVEARVEAEHKTGVELECLTAVSITLLTIYDMCKSAAGHNKMLISNICLVYKCKGPAVAPPPPPETV